MIGLSRLEKSYGGRTLFDNVSLQLNAGSRYGLVGANGSGKSTLLKILARDELPGHQAGALLFDTGWRCRPAAPSTSRTSSSPGAPSARSPQPCSSPAAPIWSNWRGPSQTGPSSTANGAPTKRTRNEPGRTSQTQPSPSPICWQPYCAHGSPS